MVCRPNVWRSFGEAAGTVAHFVTGSGQWVGVFYSPCTPEMDPGLRVTGHRVSDFDQVGSGHGSKILTRFRLCSDVCGWLCSRRRRCNTTRDVAPSSASNGRCSVVTAQRRVSRTNCTRYEHGQLSRSTSNNTRLTALRPVLYTDEPVPER